MKPLYLPILVCLAIAVDTAAGQCTLCIDGTDTPTPDRVLPFDDDGATCADAALFALTLEDTQSFACIQIRDAGLAECGCTTPPELDMNCTLCADGSSVPDPDLGIGGTTCGGVERFIRRFGESTCQAYHRTVGVHCGCAPPEPPVEVCQLCGDSPLAFPDASLFVQELGTDLPCAFFEVIANDEEGNGGFPCAAFQAESRLACCESPDAGARLPPAPDGIDELCSEDSVGTDILKRILEDWDRVLKDPPTINGRTYNDIINTADYETELAGEHQFRHEATTDADDFQKKMLELCHGSFMCAGEDKAYRFTRRIHGGPLFHYTSNCEELEELKEFMIQLYGFWKEHTESYRVSLVEKSSISDKSLAMSTESVQHHKKVRKFCERISKADAREHEEDNSKREELSCTHEMHRVADDSKNNDDNNSATIRSKIGKIHSTVKSFSYFRSSKTARRNPFKYDKEDKSPPSAAVDGNILCFIERDGTLFDRSKLVYLSNYLVEFIEVFTTAALCPTISICPSIDQLGDSIGARDDPRFFAKVQRIVHLIGMGKFLAVNNPKSLKRDAEEYSEKEWEELINLTKWVSRSITTLLNKGDLYPNRAEYLESIGFFRMFRETTPEIQKWMRMFKGLKDHAAKHGFKNYEKSKEGGHKLRSWLNNQRLDFRSGKLKSTKHRWKSDLLNSIQFPWQAK